MLYFSSTCDIQSSTTTFIDNIPLISTRSDTSSYHQQTDQDDDIIGEEVRPAPVTTMDERFRTLHVVLQDHSYSYLQLPERIEIEPPPPTVVAPQQLIAPQQSVQSNVPPVPTNSTAGVCVPLSVTTIGSSAISPSSSVSVVTTTNALLTKIPAGYTYMYNPSAVGVEKDDDASSVISTGSRTARNIEPDPGEETDTAAEGEPEDDSVTRCICEFTHDDGYMICCDKCS